ncbi:MAG: aldolase [Actinomycetales bacterium]|nr:aldolase [Actinomycetales bacterium]
MTDAPLAAAGGRPLRGLWLTALTADVVELVPLDGFDWLGVDLQHGCLEATDLPGLLRVTPLPVLARTASHDAAHLGRVLDTGVRGVIVPAVESRAEAAALVRAVRTPPEGARSTGGSRSTLLGGRARPVLLPMVETAAGLDAVEEITRVSGVDGVFVGPYDLALSLGRESVVDPDVVAGLHAVVAAARERGLLTGVFTGHASLDPLLPPVDLHAVESDIGALRRGLNSLERRSED